MRCAHCGADLPDGAMFCGECGGAVHPDQQAEPPGDENATRVVDLPAPQEPPVVKWGPENATTSEDAPADRAAASDEPVGVDETTRLPDRARAAPEAFSLHFSTGETVTVMGSGLIGRRPSPQPGEYFDTLITIDDPGRSVSKTHLEFGQDGGVFWVSDRYSANGTLVREPDRPTRLCAPGMRSRVSRGSRVDIGEQFFVVV